MNSKRKGKDGEREAAAELRRILGVDARRSQQYSGANGDGDLDGIPGVHVEVKRAKRLRIYEAVSQAVDDAPEGSTPMVLYRGDRREWLAIVRLEDLPALVEKTESYVS